MCNGLCLFLLVSFAVTGDLVLPECRIGLGKYKLFASFVAMPETAVDKDCRSILAHDDVRLARYALDIQPITVSVCPQPFPDRYLRLGCLAAYMRHAAVALCGVNTSGIVFILVVVRNFRMTTQLFVLNLSEFPTS